MRFIGRLRAMLRLGDATLRAAERAQARRLAAEERSRSERLGDVDGQTLRALALAEALETAVLAPTEPKRGWFR